MGFGLNQQVNKPTRRGNIVDLIFTNNTSLVQGTKVEAGGSDHDIFIVDLDLTAKWKQQPKRKYYVRWKANEELLNADLDTLWVHYLSMGNASIQGLNIQELNRSGTLLKPK